MVRLGSTLLSVASRLIILAVVVMNSTAIITIVVAINIVIIFAQAVKARFGLRKHVLRPLEEMGGGRGGGGEVWGLGVEPWVNAGPSLIWAGFSFQTAAVCGGRPTRPFRGRFLHLFVEDCGGASVERIGGGGGGVQWRVSLTAVAAAEAVAVLAVAAAGVVVVVVVVEELVIVEVVVVLVVVVPSRSK